MAIYLNSSEIILDLVDFDTKSIILSGTNQKIFISFVRYI